MAGTFNPNAWGEIQVGKEIPHEKGRVQLRASAPVALYVTSTTHGVEALCGVAAEFDFNVSEAVSLRVEGKARAFLHDLPVTSFDADGEIFTNIDRMPMGGSFDAVQGQTRLFELQQRQIMREMRAQMAALEAERKALNAPPAPPPADPPADPTANGGAVNDEQA